MNVSDLDLNTLMQLCKLASMGQKVIQKMETLRLSNEEKELLRAVKQNDYFAYLATDQNGAFIRAGDKDFMYAGKNADTIKYCMAFKSLCEKGYIVHKSGKQFCLSETGRKKLEKL